MMSKFIGVASAAALLAFTTVGNAATTIDFTSDTTGLGGTADGIGWVLSGSDGVVAVDPNNDEDFDGSAAPVTSLGLAFQTDGYGIVDDEVSNPPPESMTVTFDTVVQMLGFSFLDLFAHSGGTTGESVTASFSDGIGVVATINLMFNAANSASGYAETAFAAIFAKSVTFIINEPNDEKGVADGALASLTIAPVPLPAGVLLLGTALGGFGIARRMRKPA